MPLPSLVTLNPLPVMPPDSVRTVAASATDQVCAAPRTIGAEMVTAAGALAFSVMPLVLAAGAMVSVPAAPGAMVMPVTVAGAVLVTLLLKTKLSIAIGVSTVVAMVAVALVK